MIRFEDEVQRLSDGGIINFLWTQFAASDEAEQTEPVFLIPATGFGGAPNVVPPQMIVKCPLGAETIARVVGTLKVSLQNVVGAFRAYTVDPVVGASGQRLQQKSARRIACLDQRQNFFTQRRSFGRVTQVRGK